MTEDDTAGASAPADRIAGTGPADAGAAAARADPPAFAVSLWPHNSLTRRGFRWFMGALVAGLAIPFLAVAGTPVAWMLLPFLLAAVGLVWLAIRISLRRGRVHEELRLWPDVILVERTEPGGAVRRWAANPYWVRVELRDTRQVPQYLTLAGGGRTIELGAFLTPEERVSLAADLRAALGRLNAPRG
jgi:uncharacterized membrane protein